MYCAFCSLLLISVFILLLLLLCHLSDEAAPKRVHGAAADDDDETQQAPAPAPAPAAAALGDDRMDARRVRVQEFKRRVAQFFQQRTTRCLDMGLAYANARAQRQRSGSRADMLGRCGSYRGQRGHDLGGRESRLPRKMVAYGEGVFAHDVGLDFV